MNVSCDLEMGHFASCLRRIRADGAKIIELKKSLKSLCDEVIAQLKVDAVMATRLLDLAAEARIAELTSTGRKRVSSVPGEADLDSQVCEFLTLAIKLDLLGIRPELGLLSKFSINIELAPFLLTKGGFSNIIAESKKMVHRYSDIFHDQKVFMALTSLGYSTLSTANLRAPAILVYVQSARDNVLDGLEKQLQTSVRAVSDIAIDLDMFSTQPSTVKLLRVKQKKYVSVLTLVARRWRLWKDYCPSSGIIASGWEARADALALACSSGSGNKYPWAEGDIEFSLPTGGRAKISTLIVDQYFEAKSELNRCFEDVGQLEVETAGVMPDIRVGFMPVKLCRALTRFDAEEVELVVRHLSNSSEIDSILSSEHITHAGVQRALELSSLNFILKKRLSVVHILIAQGAEVVKKWPTCNSRIFDRVYWSRIAGVYDLDAEIRVAKSKIKLFSSASLPPRSGSADQVGIADAVVTGFESYVNSPLDFGRAAFEAGEDVLEQYMRLEVPEYESDFDDSDDSSDSGAESDSVEEEPGPGLS